LVEGEKNIPIYDIQDRKTKEIIMVTSSREEALSYLKDGYVVSGYEV
jgi:hypothetical protein